MVIPLPHAEGGFRVRLDDGTTGDLLSMPRWERYKYLYPLTEFGHSVNMGGTYCLMAWGFREYDIGEPWSIKYPAREIQCPRFDLQGRPMDCVYTEQYLVTGLEAWSSGNMLNRVTFELWLDIKETMT